MSITFSTPQTLTTYKDKSLRVVCDHKLNVGDKVQAGRRNDGAFIYSPITEILEERKSKGVFKEDRPFSYKVKV